jgi:hypothetical protein
LTALPRKEKQKSFEDHVKNLIKTKIDGAEDTELDALYDMMDRHAKNTCTSFKQENSTKGELAWTNLATIDKLALRQTALSMSLSEDPRLEFIKNCVDIWPFYHLIQKKWSSLSFTARKAA